MHLWSAVIYGYICQDRWKRREEKFGYYKDSLSEIKENKDNLKVDEKIHAFHLKRYKKLGWKWNKIF